MSSASMYFAKGRSFEVGFDDCETVRTVEIRCLDCGFRSDREEYDLYRPGVAECHVLETGHRVTTLETKVERSTMRPFTAQEVQRREEMESRFGSGQYGQIYTGPFPGMDEALEIALNTPEPESAAYKLSQAIQQIRANKRRAGMPDGEQVQK